MAINMEQVMQALEENENPAEVFASDLQDNEEGTEKVAEAVEGQETETPETPEASVEEAPEEVANEDDLAKVAAADDEGRIIARAFFDELNKLAVAPVADYPADPGSIPNNPALEVGRGEPAQPHGEKSMKVNAILNSLVAANKVGAPEIATPAGPAPGGKADPQEGNQPLAADAAKAQERAAVPGVDVEKNSAVTIIDSLYKKYFETEE